MSKERLDKYLTDLGRFETKSKAAAAILAGQVKINDEYITKAGFQINTQKEYEIVVKSMPYVSRGGFKLKRALDVFEFSVENRICIDAGASTGGFSDCLLQNGAKFIYAVDVGYGQLDWKIRDDKRVKVIEKTNLRNCVFSDIYTDNEPVANLLTADLSFISLTKVLPNVKKLLNPEFHEMICLIKPQFEAGKEKVEKGGIVRDKIVHMEIISNILEFSSALEYSVKGLTYSSIKGHSGNIEYLVWLSTMQDNFKPDIKGVIDSAFENFSS